jgi:hypothetical protein
MAGHRWKWRYPAEHAERLTARCAEKLKQLKAERAAKRAEWKRLEDVARLVKAARRDAAKSAVAPRIAPE